MFDCTEFEPVMLFTLPLAALKTRRVLLTQSELALVLEALPRVTTARA